MSSALSTPTLVSPVDWRVALAESVDGAGPVSEITADEIFEAIDEADPTGVCPVGNPPR